MSGDERPRLRPGVRLTFDDVRQRHALLYPEGVLFLNDTAAAVVAGCTGALTVAALIDDLGSRYDGVVDEHVHTLLAGLLDAHLLDFTGG